ncbi:HPF/RaiA family ribosome-associated protein [Pseudomonas mangiferae]|uniref:HPF/RaiA family ribosome-associated protein n=1 Tax=Pseudomonas mangiferae TaxID=2593654 RepID=A0A553GYC0_9PSED|nr:HPF/RaiA family ribosome-associated protein [Pseudomonas mangiferae]TRX74479.1 HPF/RaiA family ribosome-associated protein [Pseudomonas mangiferae]
MQIQVNSDNHIEGGVRLEEWIRATLEQSLERFDDQLTRIEVHLGDENGEKSGAQDKRCQLEARPKGLQPVSVTHKAEALDLAVEGATEKLLHALDHLFGKLQTKRLHGNQQTTAPEPGPVSERDALLQEEFLEREETLRS